MADCFGQVFRCGICSGKLAARCTFLGSLFARLAGREFKSDVAFLFIENQEGIEGTIGALRDESGNELALTLCQYAEHLLRLNSFA